MSVEIWPPIAPSQLKVEEDATQARELQWLVASLRKTLRDLKHGLNDCYALLAPIDPGSTLVLTTPHNELVKGHITRVGTRIVKGTINLKFRTIPPQTLTIEPSKPIHLPHLTLLNTLLTRSVDLLALCISAIPETDDDTDGDYKTEQNLTKEFASSSPQETASFLSSQLLVLSRHLAEALLLVKGATPLSAPADANWTTSSTSLSHFVGNPVLNRNLSLYFTLQEASLVLYLRSLEPVDAPMNLGAKLAFAIGTARRLEHDEADKPYPYHCDSDSRPDAAIAGDDTSSAGPGSASPWFASATSLMPPSRPTTSSSNRSGTVGTENVVNKGRVISGGSPGGGIPGAGPDDQQRRNHKVDVFVREKVRVESADPSLLSLSAKLGALANTLGLARRNLAAVMEQEM